MKNSEIKNLVTAFEEATTISLTLVVLPVLFLIIGVFLDKTFSTTPLFIFVGIITGVIAGIWRAMAMAKKYKIKEKKEKIKK